MAKALPNIRQPSPKNESSKKRVHRSSSIDINPQKTRLNKLVEARLAKQFHYFRVEFLEHAMSIGIPVPLDMVEDKNGRVMTFVNQKGPRYLLNIIHAYPESVHLLRSSLSFLIVIISILSRKVAESAEIDRRVINPTPHNVRYWANEALISIADSSSVAICTNLLRHAHSEAIQELILNLLAQLVSTSSEAAVQMMHRPNVNAAASSNSNPQSNLEGSGSGNGSGNPCSNPSSPRESTLPASASSSGGSNDPDEMTCLSYMFSVVAHNRNRYTVMTSCAEVCLALLKDKSSHVSESMARTWISSMPLKPGETDTKVRYSSLDPKIEKKKPKKEDYSRGKPLSVLTRKPPTTALPRGASKAALAAASTATTPRRNSTPRPKSGSQDRANPNEWAALKILLKFLHRFMRYGSPVIFSSPPDDDALGVESESLYEMPGRVATIQDMPASADKDDIVPHKHKKALYTAHSRVLLVVCELVINSPAVSSYILSMPGACSILKSSCELHKSSSIGPEVTSCLNTLQGVTNVMFKKALTTHHSMSFELTHGKSAKLFNPVSPIARRESAMLSPERVRILNVDSAIAAPTDTFTMSCGVDNGDVYTRPKSRGALVFAHVPLHEENASSRPLSRSGLVPVSRLFCTAEKQYQKREEEKEQNLREEADMRRLSLHKHADFFDEDEDEDDDVDDDDEERAVPELGDDSWFLNSFEVAGDLQASSQKSKKNKRPPAANTSMEGGGFSRPASSSQRHCSSAPSRLPNQPYNPPESPKRRGLGPHNGGVKGLKDPSESLHRSLFTNLPELPDMPVRLEAETIINDCNAQSKVDLLSRSMSMTSSVVDLAYKDGFYRDGKNNIPICERARRVYMPHMLPFQGGADRHPNYITPEYLEEQRNRPKSQGSVLAERSAQARAVRNRAKTAGASKASSFPASPVSNQDDYQGHFSDYYQGLLPLNGVGEVEPESQFQLFLVQKQQQSSGGGAGKRAATAPSVLGASLDDSVCGEESTQFEEHSSVGLGGNASYASSMSGDFREEGEMVDGVVVSRRGSVGDTSVEGGAAPTHKKEAYSAHIVQSVDMFFP